MKLLPSPTILAVLVLGTVLQATYPAQAEQTRVIFPENIDQLEQFSTVTRGDVIEEMLTTPEALAAVRNGEPMPNGTHVVLVDYREGEVFRYFIMQKGENWGADYDDRRRTGDWHFQAFTPDRSVNLNEDPARCQGCHQARAEQQFMFTFDDIFATN